MIMRSFKLVLNQEDGSKVWINIPQMLKMVKTTDGKYYIYLVDGEKYLIDHSTARMIENYFEG